MDHAYKSQLQAYAMKKRLDLPVYTTERVGPPHAPQFRSRVTFDGKTFQCPDFFTTLKTSEHAAAKIALDSIPPPQSSEGNGVVGVGVNYKNLLQELAQKENLFLPVYATVTSGPSHAPTFTSNVEYNEKVFNGEEAKTKKLAEMSAAKAAYMSIKCGNSNPNLDPNPNQSFSPPPSLPSEKQKEAVSLIVKRTQNETPSQRPLKIVTPDVPSKWIEVYEDADNNTNKKINIAAASSHVTVNPTSKTVLNHAPMEKMKASALPMRTLENPTNNRTLNDMEKVNIATASSSENIVASSGNEALSTSVDNEEEKKKKQQLLMGTCNLSNIFSSRQHQHVVVRPWNSEMVLPQDSEMLFRDDRFIAYRLS